MADCGFSGDEPYLARRKHRSPASITASLLPAIGSAIRIGFIWFFDFIEDKHAQISQLLAERHAAQLAGNQQTDDWQKNPEPANQN